MSMLFMGRDRSTSSFSSDCTSGLVGGLYTKLDDRDDESEDMPDNALSRGRDRGVHRLSKANGLKSRGGDVANAA
jgi:hypothetical protein